MDAPYPTAVLRDADDEEVGRPWSELTPGPYRLHFPAVDYEHAEGTLLTDGNTVTGYLRYVTSPIDLHMSSHQDRTHSGVYGRQDALLEVHIEAPPGTHAGLVEIADRNGDPVESFTESTSGIVQLSVPLGSVLLATLGGKVKEMTTNRTDGHADRMKPPGRRKPTGKGRLVREARGYLEALVVAFLFVTFVLNTVEVVGASMLPTLDGGPGSARLFESLLTGDRVLVGKYHNWLIRLGLLDTYEPGTIVVHRSPHSSYDYALRKEEGCFESILVDRCRPFLIKRVVAGPGDSVSIEAGQVILNGEAVDQSFITAGGVVEVQPVSFPMVLMGEDGIEALQVDWLATTVGVRVPILPTAESPTGFVSLEDPLLRQYYGSILSNLTVPEGARPGDEVLAVIDVPEASYFMLGDNRSAGGSLDSRAFGLVRAIDVAGPATAVIWPPRRDAGWNWRLLRPTAPGNETAG